MNEAETTVQRIFDSPSDAALERYNGQTCDVVRPLTPDEADLDETGPMYRVRFGDGHVAEVFADEIGAGAWRDSPHEHRYYTQQEIRAWRTFDAEEEG